MSRGLGELQGRILAAVGNSRGASFESLRWELWDGKSTESGKLPASWNTSVDRAVKNLINNRKKLCLDERPLTTLEEWVAHYPGKTHDVQIYKLRRDLLPHLRSWLVDDPSGPVRRFSPAKNEVFAAASLSNDRKKHLSSLWIGLETSLNNFLGSSGDEDAFLLLVRGKQLFGHAPVEANVSFREVVGRCAQTKHFPTPLREQLLKFTAEFLDEPTAGALQVRSYMGVLAARIPRRGHCELSEEAKDELLERCPRILSSLDGFVAANSANFGRLTPRGARAAIHSSILKKVLDQSVFQRFRFLTLYR